VGALSWVKHDETKNRLEFYLKKSGLNCKVTAIALGVEGKNPTNIVEQTVKYSSDMLKKSISKPLSQIMQAEIAESIEAAITQFRVATKQERPMEYFLPGIMSLLPEPDDTNFFNLDDCSTELATLNLFTLQYARDLVQACDPTKLAYILSLLFCKSGSLMDKDAVLRLYRGEFTDPTSRDTQPVKSVEQVDKMLNLVNNQNPYRDW
jgi:hypothetical protein